MIAVRGKVDIEHAIFYGEEYVFAGPSLTPEVPALEDRMDIGNMMIRYEITPSQ